MKKFPGVIVILIILLLTVIYRQLTRSRGREMVKHSCAIKPGQASDRVAGAGVAEAGATGTAGAATCRAKFCRLQQDLPLFQLLMQ